MTPTPAALESVDLLLTGQLSDRELATVLAGLRYWQRHGARQMLTSGNRLLEDDIATSGGTLQPLTVEEIDALCDRLNLAAHHPAPVIAIALEGGVVQSVVTDDTRLHGIAVLVIDYDTDGADEADLRLIEQRKGGEVVHYAGALLTDDVIGSAEGIDLAGAWREFTGTEEVSHG